MTDRLYKFLLFVQTDATFTQMQIVSKDPRNDRWRRWGHGAGGILAMAMRDVRDVHLLHVDPEDTQALQTAAEEFVSYVLTAGDGPARTKPSGWLAQVDDDVRKNIAMNTDSDATSSGQTTGLNAID